MNKDEYEEIKKLFGVVAYIYFSLWLILFVIGIIVQSKINKESQRNIIDDKKINNTNFYFKMDE